MASNTTVKITWLGHATTILEFDGKRILIDPWIQSNPAIPEDQKNIDRLDLMLITHGHFDHFADAVSVAQRTHPDIICIAEIAGYLESKGVENATGMNKGGAVTWNGVRVTMVDAVHSSGISDGDRTVEGGSPAGYVIRFPNDFTVYHSGDTDIFESMRLIGSRFHPDVALLPIGGHYTMDPEAAADAIRLLGVQKVIPIHYGTFPVLVGTPEELRQAASDVTGLEIIALKPGESITQEQLV
jgi:L-ascorbate metabolism protein UlaG (beta-lactamase superfamily)